MTSLKPVLVQPSGIGSSKVRSSGEVEGRRSTVAFAEAAKTSKVVKSRGLVSRVTLLLLLADW